MAIPLPIHSSNFNGGTMLLCTGALGHWAFLPGRGGGVYIPSEYREVPQSGVQEQPLQLATVAVWCSIPQGSLRRHSIEDIIPYLCCFENKWPGAQDSVSRTDSSTDRKTCSVVSAHDYYDNDAFPKVLSFSLGQ